MKQTAFLLTVGVGVLALGLCGTWAANGQEPGVATTPPVVPTDPTVVVIFNLDKEATAFEKLEKFADALAKFEEIKKFEPKYWPDGLEKRIRDVKSKKEALESFGLAGKKSSTAPAPVPAQKITRKYDRFHDRTTLETKSRNAFRLPYSGWSELLCFFEGERPSQDIKEVTLYISCTSGDWVFLKSDRTIIFLVDGKRFPLPCSSYSSDVSTTTSDRNSICHETLAYRLVLGQARYFANAEKIEAKISIHEIDFTFLKEDLNTFLTYIKEMVVEKKPIVPVPVVPVVPPL